MHADGYFDIYNRPNVTLVATREEPVVEVAASSIRTAEREWDVDVLVFATGFDAYTAPLFRLDIRGRGGKTLRDAWKNGEEIADLFGIAVPDFPNMFLVQGPQSLSLMANFLFGIQVNVDFIGRLIERLEREEVALCEADAEAAHEWAQHCQQLVEQTLIPRTESWWLGANVPGKPRPKYFPNYIGGVQQYVTALESAEAADYPGISCERSLQAAQ